VDADGKISRDEWRGWMNEKLNLLSATNNKINDLVI